MFVNAPKTQEICSDTPRTPVPVTLTRIRRLLHTTSAGLLAYGDGNASHTRLDGMPAARARPERCYMETRAILHHPLRCSAQPPATASPPVRAGNPLTDPRSLI